ncbi:MFS transporter [Tessaracoccus caeni]|uniref:MFS transporter n=1 Tax=Tessaracoccus caeni TaxID=3031239 RepID=UPI0023DA1BE1|nr:MFS transporter [Tessaracoccus caeni]MDF1487506.1 MFS transporter [Tessaracoccus caeni]
MTLINALRRLWKHAAFRRLLLLRVFSQAADGTLQVGMASYILFSPQSQPDAWSIAGVLALTLLPFTIVGPFVSPLLDRWSRREVAFYSDITRAVLALLIAVVIFSGLTSGVWQAVLYGALLVAMSINRFMLAGLSAGLQHTVDEDEFITASSIVPTVGPLGVVIGAGLGFGVRLTLGRVMESHQADAMVFVISAVLFVGSVIMCSGFTRDALGPDAPGERTRSIDVLRGLAEAGRHLGQRLPALVALIGMVVSRLLFGFFSVAIILAARNLWHETSETEAALADLTLWGGLTGAGFVLAAALVPVLVRPLGLRRTAVGLLSVGALLQCVTVFTDGKLALFVVSFGIGLITQSFKICVDTLVQAHVDEQYKGRVFTFYDMGFNGAFVASAVIAAVALPPTGLDPVAFGVAALIYLGTAVFVALAARRIGVAQFERGTESLTRNAL